MLQEHHHIPQNGMQRNARMQMQQMGPPPNQRTPMLMSMPATGVLVSMSTGPTLITTTSIPQQPAQQQPPQPKQQPPIQQVYHYDNPAAMQQQVEQEQHTTDHQHQQSNTNTLSNQPNATLANIKEKTPMCLVNELARYNKVQHQYRLTGEQGPAHKKIFTVTLKLGNEEYEAEGPSIKKAQHSAAAQALAKTEFKHPPPKTVRSRPGTRPSNPGVVTPTVELNALAMKRGERTVYVVENGGLPPHQGYLTQTGYYTRHNMYNAQQQPQRFPYDGRRNIRGHYPYHDNRYYGQFRPGAPHNPGDPYTVRLRVGEREYPGQGYTVQAARHDAAAKAIDHIKQLEQNDGSPNSSVDSAGQMQNGGEPSAPESVSSDLNTDLKSPISLVYEIALKRNLNVTFEVLSEKGPPHMKVFVTECRVGNFVADGEGNGKKISKKRAAEKMLEELSKLPPLPAIMNIAQLKRKRVPNKKKTRNLIKVNVDKTNENVDEINPISRLIQIQQANKEREPVYTVLEERGAHRRREFVIEASVNGHSCTGVGPNKKIAKRNAAEALLVELGHSTNTSNNKQCCPKTDKEPEQANMHCNDKGRKVTFVEENQQEHQAPQCIGGSGGRQLVPGVLLVTDQSSTGFQKQKDAAGGDKPIQVQQQQIKGPPPIQGVRSKDKLLYLAQLLNIQVQFSDFPKANHEMYLTLVSLGTNPPQVCHGEGSTTDASHEKAALEALRVLSELGLDIALGKENVTTNGTKYV